MSFVELKTPRSAAETIFHPKFCPFPKIPTLLLPLLSWLGSLHFLARVGPWSSGPPDLPSPVRCDRRRDCWGMSREPICDFNHLLLAYDAKDGQMGRMECLAFDILLKKKECIFEKKGKGGEGSWQPIHKKLHVKMPRISQSSILPRCIFWKPKNVASSLTDDARIRLECRRVQVKLKNFFLFSLFFISANLGPFQNSFGWNDPNLILTPVPESLSHLLPTWKLTKRSYKTQWECKSIRIIWQKKLYWSYMKMK